jgi:hypothetical protein
MYVIKMVSVRKYMYNIVVLGYDYYILLKKRCCVLLAGHHPYVVIGADVT